MEGGGKRFDGEGTYLEVISNILISVNDLLDGRDESNDELRVDKENTRRVSSTSVLRTRSLLFKEMVQAYLGDEVPRSRLSSKDRNVRVTLLPLSGGHSFEGEVSMNDRVDVHLLSLVLVQPTKKKMCQMVFRD